MTDKKEHIINKAVELFAQRGFEGTSIRELATFAGVNVAMVNYYFGSKEKLFEAIVLLKSAYLRGLLEELSKDKSLNAMDKIDRVIEGVVERLFSNRFFHRVIHQELMLNQRESLQQTIIEILFPNSLAIRGIIDEGIKNGIFKKDIDSVLTIATMFGTLNQLLLSKRMCNKLLGKNPDYVPYDDPEFKSRVIKHLKNLMHAHLLKK